MTYDRLLNKAARPTDEQIEDFIGSRFDLWQQIHTYVEKNYDFQPELAFFTKKYGWTLRYRKSGKTLCSFFPEREAFSALLVMGAKEAAKADEVKDRFTDSVREVFETTEQLRDGRWMWIRILNQADLDSLILMLTAKRKPQNS